MQLRLFLSGGNMGTTYGQQAGSLPEGNVNGYQPGNVLESKSF